MKLLPSLFVVLVALPFTASCAEPKIPPAALDALTKSKTFELYSLNPQEPPPKDGEKFHDWQILGSTKLDADKAKPLIAALQAGVAENTDGIVAACFNPRHGVRVIVDGKTHDFVICFECYQVSWFIDNERQKGFLTTGTPQAKFDAALKEVKIPLPEK